VNQVEINIPAAAEADFHFAAYGTAEVVPFQSQFKPTHYELQGSPSDTR
jgi:hypothetical protein